MFSFRAECNYLILIYLIAELPNAATVLCLGVEFLCFLHLMHIVLFLVKFVFNNNAVNCIMY